MTDAALLTAIVAGPDDDTPRLVFADWLDENDRPDEAAFLRVQCALAANGPDHPDHPDLLTREADLKAWLGTHQPDAPVALPKNLQLLAGASWWATAHRGFPRYVTFDGNGRSPAKAVRTIGPALEQAFAALPTRAVVLRFLSPPQLAEVLRLPVLDRVTELKLEMRVAEEEADEVARVVASSGMLRNLRGLSLWFPVGEAGCAALASSPHLGKLEAFSAHATNVSAAAVVALSGGGWFANLRTLELDGDPPDAVLETLAAVPRFEQLHTLHLPQATHTAAGWQALARSAAFPRLARLVLEGGDMSGGRAAALARGRNFALRVLDLERCGISNDGAEALANSPQANGLRVLNLTANRVGPSGAAALCGSPQLASLRHLSLRQNVIGVGGLKALGENPALRGLIALDLADQHSANSMTTAHVREFLEAFAPADLRHLSLSSLPVGVRGAKQIASSPAFAGLTRLGLSGCSLGDGGAAALVASPQLQNLIQLEMSENQLTNGVKGLTDRGVMPRLANCELSRNALLPDVAAKLNRRGFRT